MATATAWAAVRYVHRRDRDSGVWLAALSALVLAIHASALFVLAGLGQLAILGIGVWRARRVLRREGEGPGWRFFVTWLLGVPLTAFSITLARRWGRWWRLSDSRGSSRRSGDSR